MKTVATILHPTRPPMDVELDWPTKPGLDVIHRFVRNHIPNDEPEHVYVLNGGQRVSMFVGENSANGAQRENRDATAHYRRASLTHDPRQRPEDMPAIYGPAVLFSRLIWS